MKSYRKAKRDGSVKSPLPPKGSTYASDLAKSKAERTTSTRRKRR